jgi:hypothetical protein
MNATSPADEKQLRKLHLQLRTDEKKWCLSALVILKFHGKANKNRGTLSYAYGQ